MEYRSASSRLKYLPRKSRSSSTFSFGGRRCELPGVVVAVAVVAVAAVVVSIAVVVDGP